MMLLGSLLLRRSAVLPCKFNRLVQSPTSGRPDAAAGETLWHDVLVWCLVYVL